MNLIQPFGLSLILPFALYCLYFYLRHLAVSPVIRKLFAFLSF
jgi:hypothetical protein